MGHQGGTSEFGITEFTFAGEGSLNIRKSDLPFAGFSELNTCFSDSSGNLLAVFNGFWIDDATGQKMKGGDSIRYKLDPSWLVFGYSSDSDIPQGGMFLPWPGRPDSLLLFYVSQGNRVPVRLSYSPACTFNMPLSAFPGTVSARWSSGGT
jgi:hypothetical protein